MQDKPKSNSVVTTAWNADLVDGVLTITVLGLSDGTIKFNAREVVSAAAYDALNALGKRSVLHGFGQRLPDRAAIARDKVTGQAASPAEKFAAIKALAEHYANGGTWELAGGGLPPLQRPFMYQAIAAVRGYKVETVEATYRDKADDVLRSFLTIPQIAGKYTELCKAVAKPDDAATKAMFAELEKMAELEKATQPKPEEPKEEPKLKANKGFRKDGTQG